MTKYTYWTIIIPAGILIALVSQLYATRCGLGLTFDSHLYLDGAAYFNGQNNNSMASLLAFQAKPPLFSFVLSLVGIGGAKYLFSALLIINLLMLAWLIRILIDNLVWSAMAFITIAGFTPFVMVHVYLWTEPLFLTFLYASVIILLNNEHKLSTTSFILLCVAGVALMMTRHVGLYFSIGVAAALFGRLNYRHALIYLVVVLTIFIIWNFGMMSEGMQGRIATLKAPLSGGTWGRIDNFYFFFDAVTKWIFPNSLMPGIRLPLSLILIIFLVVKARDFGNYNSIKSFQSLLLVIVIYYLLMHVAFRIDPSSAERYLMPIYPLCLILAYKILAVSFLNNNRLKKLVTVLLLLWLSYPGYRLVKNTLFWERKICNENFENVALIDRSKSQLVMDDN